MATFVDLATETIVGAKENSLVWFHEKGHIVYNKSEKGMRNDYTRESMKTLTIVFSLLAHFHFLYLWLACGYAVTWIYYSMYEEAWAWKYASRNKKLYKEQSLIKDKGVNDES